MKKLEHEHFETKKKLRNRFKIDILKEESGLDKPEWECRQSHISPLGN